MTYCSCWSLLGFALLACGASERGSEAAPAAPAVQPEATEADEASAVEEGEGPSLRMTLAGEASPLIGSARLEVREQNPVADITAVVVYENNHDNFVQFKFAVVGVENAVGFHSAEVGPPGAAAFARAYLDGASYSSGSGLLELTLTGDGSISGTLETELFKDSEPGKLDETGERFHVSGSFEGAWTLLCRSPVQALPGDHSVSDSPYCNGLKF